MTAHNVILLTCDHDGCTNTWAGRRNDTVSVTRVQARDYGGWRTTLRMGVLHDWCRFHA